MKNRSFPVASVVAFLLIGFAWVYLLSSETPRGQVKGVTVLTDADGKPLSGCDVYLTPATKDENDESITPSPSLFSGKDARERRRAVTDGAGRFTIRDVPTGVYSISASARWHSTPDMRITVEEGSTTENTLRLARSEPDLNVGDHQATFSTGETPFLPVRGYTMLPKNADDKQTKPQLSVKIWQTRLSEVLKRDDAATDFNKLRYSYSGNPATLTKALMKPNAPGAVAPKLIADTSTAITGADQEGFFTSRLPLEAARAKPGLYLVKFSYGKFSASSYVLVTNLALVVKKSQRELVAYTAELQKGTAVQRATVRILRNGQTYASGQTGADGVTRLALPPSLDAAGTENGIPTLTMATLGNDEAVVSGTSYGNDGGSGRYVVHTVTDRTIYRPGDTIQYKGITRLRDDKENGGQGYTIPRDMPVSVEIRDASGGLVKRETKTTGASGTFWGSVETSPEGATGSYMLVTTIGGEQYTSDITVAAYRKPEFAVTIKPLKARYHRGETVEMALDAAYYFGAPVAGAKVHYYVYRDADWSAEYGNSSDYEMDEYESHYRDSAYRNYYGEAVAEGDVTLDENGKATVRVRTDVRHPEANGNEGKPESDDMLPQVESYTLTAEVKDQSQRSVEGEGVATVAAGDLTASISPEGYVALPSKPTQVFVSIRDAEKNPVSGIAVTLSSAYDEWDAKKKKSITSQLGTPQTATTGEDGRAILSVTPTRTGELRLTATTKDSGGRAIRSEASLWVAGDAGDDLNTDYGDLSLLTDKRKYLPGDTARVLVNTSRTGQNILLSVEGDRVYQTISVPARKRSTVVRIPIKAEWGPNVSLVANYVRNKKFASSEIPLRVTLAARDLRVAVRAVGGDRYQPGDRVTYAITTRTASGQPVAADFALGVVDESIYALREDDPKALRRTFFPSRMNRVSTSFSFSVEYLGDVSKAEPNIKARTKFRDTAFWMPGGQTDASGTATVSVVLPDNLTTWRATVNAVGAATAVGYTRSKIVSTKPFFLRLETPRYLVGGDQSRLMAIVHNETGKDQQVQVRLIASTLRLGEKETQSVRVAAGGVGTVSWSVRLASNSSGDAPLRVTAWTPKAAGEKSYADGIEKSLPVRSYGRTAFTTFAGELGDTPVTSEETQPDTLSVSPDQLTLRMDPAAVAPETRLTLRVTPSVRGVFAGGIEYLVGFPYGCTEQTMSRFYPDLLVREFGPLANAETQADLPRMIRDGVARLSRFQHGETGGWGWWETGQDDPFMTAYVLVGLSKARSQGYPVDDAMLERGVQAAAKMATTAPVRSRPFLLYALAQTGYTDEKTGLLTTPFRTSAKRTKLVPAKLPVDALAYLTLLGRQLGENYEPFYDELNRRAIVQGRLIHWTSYRKQLWKVDCSDRMATALALRAMLAVNPADDRIPATLRYLMQSRTDGYFGDTRDTSWVLVALCDYLRAHPEDAQPPSGTLAIEINGTKVRTVDLATDAQGEGEVVLKLPTNALRPGTNTVRFVRSDDATGGNIFFSGALRQTVAAPAGAELPAVSSNGVTVKREVLRVLPRKVGADAWGLVTEPVSDGKFAQGDRLRVRLTITATRDCSYVLIEDTFPSGAEITERGTADEEVSGDSWQQWYDHVDVRDDRIAFFARKMLKGKHVLEYNLRAQTPGTSRALPTVIQGMYDAGLRAESGATPLEIRQ